MQSNGTLVPDADSWQGGYEGFTEAEMQCKCGCKGLPKHSLMVRLVKLRQRLGPLVISSGFRCKKHNARVSTTGDDGPHTTGLAADVAVSGAKAIKLLIYAYELGFRGFGVSQKGATRFMHLDLVEGRGEGQIWSY